MKTINIPFQRYYTREYKKTQIFIHHTVSPNKLHGGGIDGDLDHWNNQSYNLGTYCIIDADGTVYQLFDSNKWSHHLGLKASTFEKYEIPYYKLDKTSIGIEIDNLGPLVKTPEGFKSFEYDGQFTVPEDRVIDYGEEGYRGHRYYEAYTKEQIESLRLLLLGLTALNQIPKQYNEDMWDMSIDALRGVPGIYTHTSVRADKSDCHPQIDLVDMLKELKPKPPIKLPIGKPLIFTDKDKGIKDLENSLSQIGWNKNINEQ